MQLMMARILLLVCLSLASAVEGSSFLRSQHRAAADVGAFDRILQRAATNAFMAAESEDRSFMITELATQEAELEQLLHVVNTPVAKAKPNKVAKADDKTKDAAPVFSGSPSELAPMLIMLKGLYKEGRARIGHLNQREKEAKKRFEVKAKAHKAELARIEGRFHAGKIGAEFRTNETREEMRSWAYWNHVRDGEHKQFHNMLKMQHATMEKEKSMIDLYEKALAGKTAATKIKKELSEVAGGIPDVVLLQEARASLTAFCGDALTQVKAVRADLVHWSSTLGKTAA